MPEFKAPVRDIEFAMFDVLDYESHWQKLPGTEEVNRELVSAIVEEAAKFAEQVVAPINQVGDQEGCQWNDGAVTTPAGFKEAYQQSVEGGWPSLAHDPEHGGQGLPPSLAQIVNGMNISANHAWAMYHGLTGGAIETVEAHGTEEMKSLYLPRMIEGSWSGTMCLTESHCGSDLGLLRTKAEPVEDGSYRLSGTKIFISAGEHDMTENIVHIVLARLPDAPEGVRGISLFLVPKFLVNADGSLGERNGVSCGSIEHKMGIHGNATCVMNFDGAVGYLIGTENRGLNHMFTFINNSRLGVAAQGQSLSELSYQGSLAYAKERLQMRAPKRKLSEQPADPIIVHADVRRMLLTQKAIAEGGRLLIYYLCQQVDIQRYSKDPEAVAAASKVMAFMTPIAKGFLTEIVQECAYWGVQVFGGHGYIAEWGMEQISRDARIAAIYEGTSGIQGIDLLDRKIFGMGKELLTDFSDEVLSFCSENAEQFGEFTQPLSNAIERWLDLTDTLGARALEDVNATNAAAYNYLMMSGYITVAYFMARSAVAAKASGDGDFEKAKLNTVRFYFQHLLPRISSLIEVVQMGSDVLMELEDEQFV